jgi:hypothetical protein
MSGPTMRREFGVRVPASPPLASEAAPGRRASTAPGTDPRARQSSLVTATIEALRARAGRARPRSRANR